MRTLSKTASKTLNTLTTKMKPGQVRRIGEKGGAFMQVIVERLTEDRYSVTHYYEQAGDLCPDPDVEFYRFETGAWIPVCIRQYAGYRQAVDFDAEGKPSCFYPRTLRELCSFTTTWMKNIRAQQDLKNLPAAC